MRSEMYEFLCKKTFIYIIVIVVLLCFHKWSSGRLVTSRFRRVERSVSYNASLEKNGEIDVTVGLLSISVNDQKVRMCVNYLLLFVSNKLVLKQS